MLFFYFCQEREFQSITEISFCGTQSFLYLWSASWEFTPVIEGSSSGDITNASPGREISLLGF